MRYEVYKFSSQCQNEVLDLIKLDNRHCWLALLEDYSLICISVVASCWISWYLYPLAILIIGSRQRALATLLHEAAHQTLAKNKHLNFAIGTFFSGYLILQTMGSYRESHVRFHHGHFGDMNLDPDYKFAMEEGWYDRTMLPKEFVSKNIIRPFFLTKVGGYFRYLIQYRLLDRNYAK